MSMARCTIFLSQGLLGEPKLPWGLFMHMYLVPQKLHHLGIKGTSSLLLILEWYCCILFSKNQMPSRGLKMKTLRTYCGGEFIYQRFMNYCKKEGIQR